MKDISAVSPNTHHWIPSLNSWLFHAIPSESLLIFSDYKYLGTEKCQIAASQRRKIMTIDWMRSRASGIATICNQTNNWDGTHLFPFRWNDSERVTIGDEVFGIMNWMVHCTCLLQKQLPGSLGADAAANQLSRQIWITIPTWPWEWVVWWMHLHLICVKRDPSWHSSPLRFSFEHQMKLTSKSNNSPGVTPRWPQNEAILTLTTPFPSTRPWTACSCVCQESRNRTFCFN